MTDTQRRQKLLVTALLLTVAFLLFIYARQRLFTQTEPIVLAS